MGRLAADDGQATENRAAEYHAENVRVNGVAAENLRKMWCKCGAGQLVTASGSPNSAPCKPLTW